MTTKNAMQTVVVEKRRSKNAPILKSALSYYRLASKSEKHGDIAGAKRYRTLADQMIKFHKATKELKEKKRAA